MQPQGSRKREAGARRRWKQRYCDALQRKAQEPRQGGRWEVRARTQVSFGGSQKHPCQHLDPGVGTEISDLRKCETCAGAGHRAGTLSPGSRRERSSCPAASITGSGAASK